MSVYEERLQRDLTTIRDQVRDLSTRTEESVKGAVESVLRFDRRLANETMLRDRAINRGTRELENLCHRFVVRHFPSAGHLRYASSVLRLCIILERIGDYAVTICREVVQLSGPLPGGVLRDAELLGHQAQRIFSQAVRAFREGNIDLAKSVKSMAEQVEDMFQKVFDDLVATGEREARPVKDLFAALLILKALKRVTDQADNMASQTIFAVVGETKEPKMFRILFADEANTCQSQIAEAYARKVFPVSGFYTSAGWNPGDALDPAFIEFMDEHGHDLRTRKPKRLEPLDDEHRHYHVIASLDGTARPHLDEVPFRTAMLEWDVGPIPEDFRANGAKAQMEEVYRRIAHEIRNLMELLRGPDAD
jgi:phosphate transport system protein